MNERSLEIIVRSCPEAVFGPGWSLRAQQLSLPSGRIDLLLSNGEGELQLVELKKGSATPAAVDQVLRYLIDLRVELDDAPVIPWVVGHSATKRTVDYANNRGVRVLAVPLERCSEIMTKHGITESILLGRRKDGMVISGGGAKRGLRQSIPNHVAYASMPPQTAAWLEVQEHAHHMDVATGGIQTVLHYRGVKLGGVNRTARGGVAYIASGVVLTAEQEQRLIDLGFRRMTKTKRDSPHEHIWWEILSAEVEAFGSAVQEAKELIDRAFGL